MRRWRRSLVFLLPVVLALVAGCGQTTFTVIDADQLAVCQVTADDLTLPAQPFTGLPATAGIGGASLTMDGSTALYPLFQAAAPAFDQANGAKTNVGQGGSVTGLHDYDGTVVNWRQLGGPDEAITVIERPLSSGTRATFETYVLGEAPSSPTGAAKALYLTKDSSDLVAQAIAATPGSIGYVATGYITNPSYRSSIFPVCIDAHPPTEASINAGSYRFWNYEHAYTKGAPSPVAQAFLSDMTSTAVQESLLPAKGFLRIDQLSSAAAATHPQPAGSA